MKIHDKFWKARNNAAWQFAAVGNILTKKRDSLRQRCYDWENKALRPHGTKFATRDAAKGFARICMKVAVQRMRDGGLITTDDQAAQVRLSFKAAFADEHHSFCNANEVGCYFARWGWTDVIIAHEVAHWADRWAQKLAPSDSRYVAFEGHGPTWRGWFIDILAQTMRNPPAVINVQAWLEWTLTEAKLKFRLPNKDKTQ